MHLLQTGSSLGNQLLNLKTFKPANLFCLSNPLKVTSRFQYTVPNLLPANKHGFLKKGGFKFTGITDFIILQRKVIKGKPIYYKTNYLQRTVGVENKICSKSAAKFNNFLVYWISHWLTLDSTYFLDWIKKLFAVERLPKVYVTEHFLIGSINLVLGNGNIP